MANDENERTTRLKDARRSEPDIGTLHVARLKRGWRGRTDRFQRCADAYGVLKQGSSDREIELHIDEADLRRLSQYVLENRRPYAHGVYILRFKPDFLRRLKNDGPA